MQLLYGTCINTMWHSEILSAQRRETDSMGDDAEVCPGAEQKLRSEVLPGMCGKHRMPGCDNGM